MIDKRLIDTNMLMQEMSIEELTDWFSFTKKKFLHNIDTFYYSVKFKNDFRVNTKDEKVLRFRKFFKFKYDGLGQYDETGEIYLKEINKSLKLRPVVFSKFYDVCLSNAQYFDIFIASSVPRALNGGESVTSECIVQIRSYMLWMFGVNAAFENSYAVVKELAAYFGFEIDFVQENRVDYCWHSNYLKNPEVFFNLENLYKMRVDRFKGATHISNKVGSEGYEVDYVALGKRGDKVFVRIYQKTREVIEMNYKPWFFQIWKMNGLLNNYDLYVYEKCYLKRSWYYRFYARLEFYAEYGKSPLYVSMCKEILSGEVTIGEDDLIKLASQLTPELNLVVNVEFQTMRRHSKSYTLLPLHDNSDKNECKRIYDYLDNRKLIMDYLTDKVLKFVEKTGDSKKYRRPLCGFWESLRRTKCIDVKMTPEQLHMIRQYNRKLSIPTMKKKFINAAVTLSIYCKGINQESTFQDCFDALMRMNDNDIMEAQRYKNKKVRQFNQDELSGLYENDEVHRFSLLDEETGTLYNNNTLNAFNMQGGVPVDREGSL